MLKNTRQKHVRDFLQGRLRNLLPRILVFSLAIIPLASDAFAVMKTPPVPTGIETMKSGFFGHPNEVADFNPHFGWVPLTVPAPIPTVGRSLWCYGPIYICLPTIGCQCLRLPRNWCYQTTKCMLTNIINLEATLLIKHAWPEGGERMKDASNLTVYKPDNLYRDLCVNGAKLNYDRFDPKTGQVIVPMVKVAEKDTYTPATSALYDSTTTGTVRGSRSELGTCMPRINNEAFAKRDPKFATPTNGNAAFSYYVNAGDDPYFGVGKDDKDPVTIYGTSNRYLKTTFFLSGRFGCPSEISGIPVNGKVTASTPEAAAKIWKEAASKCYDYYIFSRATHPEWTLERPGGMSDDPLTLDANRGGNPDLAIFESCQPMLSGPDSEAVFNGLSPVGRGYAPVLQYQRPDLDEADYSPRIAMQRSFVSRFPGRPIPGFQNVFPCIKNMSDAGSLVQTDWSDFNLTLAFNYATSFMVESTVIKKKWGPQYFVPMQNESYTSPGQYQSGFCPNVEKINVPTHPFSPRNDIRSLEHPEGIDHPEVPAINLVTHITDLLLSGPKYIFDKSVTNKYFTDREYSYMTSFPTPEDRIFHTWSIGYSDYNKLIYNPAGKITNLLPSMGGGEDNDPDNNALPGTGISSQITDIAKQVQDGASTIKDAAQKIQELAGKVQTVAGKVQTLTGQVQTTIQKIEAVKGQVQTVTGKVQTLTTQAASLPGKVTTLTNQVTGLANQAQSIISRLNGLPGQVQQIPAQVTSIPNQVITGAATSLQNQITTGIQNKLTTIQSGVSSSISTGLTNLKDKVTNGLSSITGIGDTVSGIENMSFSDITSNMMQGVKDAISSGISSGVDTVKDGITNGIQTGVQTIQDGVKNGVDTALSGVQTTVNTVKQQVANLPNTVASIQGQITAIENAISGMNPSQVPADIVATLADMKNQIANAIPAAINDVKGIIDTAQTAIPEIQNGVTAVQNGVSDIQNSATDIQNSLNEVQNGASDLSSAISEATNTPTAPNTSTNPASAVTSVVADLLKREKYPEVMCAVVPVDILEPRRKAFDSCIMERINFNYTTWRRRNFLSYYYSTQNGDDGGLDLSLPVMALLVGSIVFQLPTLIPAVAVVAATTFIGRDGTLKPWKKPCVTRFYETDTFEECPVAMSIQQCCRIIVKDVVPMNYIKIRTCEGLRQKRNMVFGYDHIFDYSERVKDTFKDDWAIAHAQAEIDRATNDVDRQKAQANKASAEQIVLTADFKSPIPIVSQGGRSMPTPLSQAQYDQVFTENQRLTTIGCDNTEPDTYSFAYYFNMSKWSDTKTLLSPVTKSATLAAIPLGEALKGLQKLSDKAVDDTRKFVDKSLNNQSGLSLSGAWEKFYQVKEGANDIIQKEQDIADQLLAKTQQAKADYEKAKKFAEDMATAEGAALTAVGSITPEVIAAQGKELLKTGGIWNGEKVAMPKAADAFEKIKAQELNVIDAAEDTARNFAKKLLDTKDQYVIANAKNAANKVVGASVSSIKTLYSSQISKIVDAGMKLAYGTGPAALISIEVLGEGGAHMPYMRHWDTGTSSGNPLHGGSFINTLGSYDVVIGVGHEERTYADANNTSTDTKTVQNAGAVEAAWQALQAAKDKYEALRKDLIGRVRGMVSFMNTYGHGLIVPAGQRIYWGTGDNADKVYFSYNSPSTSNVVTVGAMGVCNLWRGGGALANGYGHDSDCNPDYTDKIGPIQTALPIAKKAVADAEAAFQAARHEAIFTPVTSSANAHIDEYDSPIKTAHMGRIDGWDGLKGHQMLSIYRKNLSCIGRYEKLFKDEGAENFVLSRAGISYSTQDNKNYPWPLAWRGYITDPDNEFEKYGNVTGLDNAEAGDIAIYMLSGKKRIGYIAYVNQTEPKFIKLESWDEGKFPTSAGATMTLGNIVDRTIYKSVVPAMEKIDKLPAGKAARVDGQPSCEDPGYTSCKLGGSLDIIGKDGKIEENIANSTWETVKIYRPRLDTDHRQCPMIDTRKGNGDKLDVPLSEVPSNSIAFCINAGFDPPYRLEGGYKGAGAGVVTDATLCGPEWGTCKLYTSETDPAKKQAESLCFPGRQPCLHPAPAPLTIPPDVKTSCTEEEYNKALKDYQDDIAKIGQEKLALDQKNQEAIDAIEKARAELVDYQNGSTAENSEGRVKDATDGAAQKTTDLNNNLQTANNNLAAAQAIVIPAPILGPDGVTVTNQAEINSITAHKNAEIDKWSTQINNINAELNKQSNILCVSGAITPAIDDLKAKEAAVVTARNNLNNYIDEHPTDESTPKAEAITIAENVATLRKTYDDAIAAADQAREELNARMKTLDCISPPTSDAKAKQAASDAKIKELQDKLKKAIADGDKTATDAENLGSMKMPEMACPYVPLAQQQQQ